MRSALFLLPLLSASDAWSCATCFGAGGNKDMIRAFYIGGGILLVCVFSILISLVAYIRRSERRKTAVFARMGLMVEGEKSAERWPL